MPFHKSGSVFDLKYQGYVVLHALKYRNRSYFQFSLQQAGLNGVRKWLYHLDTLKLLKYNKRYFLIAYVGDCFKSKPVFLW